MAEKNDTSLYQQVNESMKHVLDLTSRIDERVKMLIDQNSIFSNKIDIMNKNYSEIVQRITILESYIDDDKIQELEKRLVILELQSNDVKGLIEKLSTFEDDHKELKRFKKSAENNFKTVFDAIYKIITMLIGAYLLWKFGWN
jgi:hypothetical protein